VIWWLCIDAGTDASSVQQDQPSNDDSSSSYSVSEPATKKKKVKRVSWVDESKLCSYFYFQLDETERGKCRLIVQVFELCVLLIVLWAELWWSFATFLCCNIVIVVNVNRAKDFAETRKHEQEMERQVMQNVRRMAHDTMTEKQEVRQVCSVVCLSC